LLNTIKKKLRKEDNFSLHCKLITPRKQVEIHQMTTAEKSNGHLTHKHSFPGSSLFLIETM